MMPDATMIAQIRAAAEDARIASRPLTIKDQEQIKALIQMCNEILRISAPAVDAFRLELMPELRAASRRALMARGVVNLKVLAQTEAARLIEFHEMEGVTPPITIEHWPQIAANLVAQISGGRVVDEIEPEEEVDPDEGRFDIILLDGIGAVTAQAFQALLGINTLFDLAEFNPDELKTLVLQHEIRVKGDVRDLPERAQALIEQIQGAE